MIKVGDELFNGAVVVAEVNSEGKIVKVTIPLLGAPGVPFTVSFDPAVTVEELENILSGGII